MKKITVLGSTGSIGTQALDVIRNNKDIFEVESLTCGRNIDLFIKQIHEFKPKNIVVERAQDGRRLKEYFELEAGSRFPVPDIYHGDKGLEQVVQDDSHTVLNSLMGIRGLLPTYKAIQAKKDIALANKETLVAGGSVIMEEAEKNGVKILPVDSEHSAIFQCISGNQGKDVKRILLTASGGPFRRWKKNELENVTVEQALNHPNWSMGKKITIDSATMMNKGLEVIEAMWLFDIPLDKIQVLVHPQSILHSAVEFKDTSIIGQMGLPDMRVPISVALGYPDRLEYGGESLDFFSVAATLTFEKPRMETMPCLALAYRAQRLGGTYPVCLNGANEVLVELFLQGKIKFMGIPEGVEEALTHHESIANPTLEDILSQDAEVRDKVRSKLHQ